ncbi:MAG: cell division protein FtsQ [Solirubrobacterales bacterium]|jgi:cell division septal protein FtsQ|nr:cell division protein FtsQ [Solirubrobacterales bacterium]
MASSRSSTSSSRRRPKAGGAKASPRKRSGTAHKPPPKKKPAAQKPKPKTQAKPKPKHQARGLTPKPKRKSTTRAPRRLTPQSSPGYLVSRAITIAFVVGTITLGLAAAYWFWFRDSSFVAVEKVTVDGIEGPETAAVTAALSRTAETMTTLNVDDKQLAAAVSRFPTVVAIETDPNFPHGLTIHVTDRPPVMTASDGGPAVAVAADGTLLNGVDTAEAGLPAVQVDSLPVKGKLEGEPLALAQVAGAAPGPLRPLIDALVVNEGEGIQVTLEGGIPVKFGDSDAAEAKWAAVAAILANPKVKTLTHLDVRVPERPSVGGAAPAARG